MAVWSCFFMHRSVQRKYAAVNICSDIDKKTMVTLKGCAMVFLCTRASRGKCQHALTDARRASSGEGNSPARLDTGVQRKQAVVRY